MKRKLLVLIILVITPSVFATNLFSNESFSRIEANGRFNIQIMPATNAGFDIDQSEPCVTAVVRDDTLFLTTNIPPREQQQMNYHAANVMVWLPMLTALSLNGDNTVTVKDVKTSDLNINTDNSNVTFNGVVNVKKIDANGNSRVSLRWVNGGSVNVITEDNARIHLAGVANLLQARAYGHSYLDAQYLRTPAVLVYTEDDATAEVLPTHSLYAFAYDSSNIYYYKTSKHLLESTQISGNVLQMGYWR